MHYTLEMDSLIGNDQLRRGCLYQPGSSRYECQFVRNAAMKFPDDIIERRSVEAYWVAVFPVGGASA